MIAKEGCYLTLEAFAELLEDYKRLQTENATLTSQVSVLTKERDALANVPLCADHAQTWFTARNEVRSESGCWFCDQDAKVKARLSAVSEVVRTADKLNDVIADVESFDGSVPKEIWKAKYELDTALTNYEKAQQNDNLVACEFCSTSGGSKGCTFTRLPMTREP